MMQVAEPWMPILLSTPPHTRFFLLLSSEPSALSKYLGTRNSEMPSVPAGASGSLASTMWMMFSTMSCSPHEMKILVPFSLNDPSASGSARVLQIPRSVPQCGSVRHIVPLHSPELIFVMYFSFSSSLACSASVLMAPMLRPGYMPQDQLAEPISSEVTNLTEGGSPMPPYFLGTLSDCQPPETYCSHASLKPRGVFTSALLGSKVTPSWSPTSLMGASTSSQNLAVSSMIIPSVSLSAPSKPSFSKCSGASSTSKRQNRMSRRGAL